MNVSPKATLFQEDASGAIVGLIVLGLVVFSLAIACCFVCALRQSCCGFPFASRSRRQPSLQLYENFSSDAEGSQLRDVCEPSMSERTAPGRLVKRLSGRIGRTAKQRAPRRESRFFDLHALAPVVDTGVHVVTGAINEVSTASHHVADSLLRRQHGPEADYPSSTSTTPRRIVAMAPGTDSTSQEP